MTPSLPFKQLKKTRLYEDVAEQIKQAIFDGHLKPGDRLPSERDLCISFDVGRPTIREALRVLAVMGLVEIGTGVKGSTVRNVDISQYLDAVREHLSQVIGVSEKTIRELWGVRKYVELGIARSAAENATTKDFKKLNNLVKKMADCGDNIQTYFPLATEFHIQLALATKNNMFYMVWRIFEDILLKGYMPKLKEMFPAGHSKLLESNRILLRAIESKDPELIEEAINTHAEEEEFFSSHPHRKVKD